MQRSLRQKFLNSNNYLTHSSTSSVARRDRRVVRTLRCSRSNPGSNLVAAYFFFGCFLFQSAFFVSFDLLLRCDVSYVGYTRRHLYRRIEEHKRSGLIFNHSQSQHPSRTITSNMFHILKKCSSKFDCLLYEMFLIREHKPCLNIQSDSIKANLFT